MTFRYNKTFVFEAINYSDAKRKIEARTKQPLFSFWLEYQRADGSFAAYC